jgi:curved DNA-binding protein CbpA
MAPATREPVDYYAILGVGPGATDEEIRRAYRRLALHWHPDRNPGRPEAEERFKAISEAYAVLIDPAKRRAWEAARQRGTPGDFRPRREDLFRDLFADPGASAVFEELAREFERMGLRVDRHRFETTLGGGRVVVTGGIFIIGPWTPVLALYRLGRAALGGAWRAGQARAMVGGESRQVAALPPARGLLDRAVRALRWLWGEPAAGEAKPTRADAALDLAVELRLTAQEAANGCRKPVALAAPEGQREVLVSVPPGVRPDTRLRLRGQGRSGPDGRRGDAFVSVKIGERS